MNSFEASELWKKNRKALAEAHETGRSHSSGKPAHMKIELTNFCNLSCSMCPHSMMKRAVGYMKFELFKKIIDQSAPELEFAYLHHLGESLFHPKVGEFIKFGKSKGVAMGLSTNATYLDKRKSKVLLENNIDFLVISMDGASPDTYDRIRVGGEFQTTVSNVRSFLENKKNYPECTTSVVVQMIVTPENHHEIKTFIDQWRDDGVHVMIKEARDWAGQVQIEGLEENKIDRTPCKMLWTELTVLWDGAVVPCVNVYERENLVGDFSTQNIDEIWNGPELKKFREAHLKEQVAGIKVCETCPRHRFNHEEFVSKDQFAHRLDNYTTSVHSDVVPKKGLS